MPIEPAIVMDAASDEIRAVQRRVQRRGDGLLAAHGRIALQRGADHLLRRRRVAIVLSLATPAFAAAGSARAATIRLSSQARTIPAFHLATGLPAPRVISRVQSRECARARPARLR